MNQQWLKTDMKLWKKLLSKIKKFDQFVVEQAKQEPNIQKYLTDTTIRKVIYVPGKLLNLVVS